MANPIQLIVATLVVACAGAFVQVAAEETPAVSPSARTVRPANGARETQNDWPQFCGPNRDSVVAHGPRLLDTWPKDGPPLAWKSAPIPGWTQGGCGSPAVADGKVFVSATAKEDMDRSLFSVQRELILL